MRSFVVLGCAALLVAVAEREASACGGCFAPPDVPTVVTDHRMIMSISKDQSTLYDQIRYTGEPSAFAWVLPIAGTVQVGLSSDELFAVLDRGTEVRVQPPALVCRDSSGAECDQRRGLSGGAVQPEEGVDVISRQVVGPYETVQLASSDPAALDTWLATNGFAVPADVKPVIATYITEKFNFLALRLVPGKGVQDMRPVRITTTGAGAVLPLRMVAAGTGAVVGITLWTVAEGRYEPQGFPSFVIKNEELTWDPVLQRSNYADARAAKTNQNGGRAWEIESSVAVGALGPVGGYEPVKDSNGNVVKTDRDVAQEDIDTLLHGMTAGSIRVTRLRADLSRAALDRDLPLSAAADQSPIAPVRQATSWRSQPPGCPAGCVADGAPGSVAPNAPPAGDITAPSSSSSSCATGATETTGWVTFALGALAFVAVRRRRR